MTNDEKIKRIKIITINALLEDKVVSYQATLWTILELIIPETLNCEDVPVLTKIEIKEED